MGCMLLTLSSSWILRVGNGCNAERPSYEQLCVVEAISEIELVTNGLDIDFSMCFVTEAVKTFFQDVYQPGYVYGIACVEYLGLNYSTGTVAV